MVNTLYAVTAFTCALVVMILPARTRASLDKNDRLDKAFLTLINWTAVFCIADCLWGVLASDVVMNDTILKVCSFIFHLFASFTPYVWLIFILAYGEERKHALFYKVFVLGLFFVEVALLVLNFWDGCIFYVDDTGAYQTGPLRKLLFWAQYATYIVMAIINTIRLRVKGYGQKNNLAILAFLAAPLICGIFQKLYPDAPAYSIGYTLGCCVIFTFILTDLLEARIRENTLANSANHAKTVFLNNMSHDIRTPLNAITGFNNMALRELGKDDDKVRECLEKVNRSSDTLLTILNDILEISRIESGKVSFSRDKGNVEYSFVNIEAMLTEIARTAGIDLKFSVGQVQDKFVICDFAQVTRIFTNLVTNAIKYTQRGGWVKVRGEQIGRRSDGYGIYRYTVQDNGIGMSEEFQKTMFQQFSRERTSTVSKIQGTGLGLALCKDLTEMMGGTISCESVQGKGSTFTVVLPFKIQEGQEYLVPGTDSGEIVLSFEGKRVLLVEDNELNREIATALLEEMGFKVIASEDGVDAVEKVRGGSPGDFDVILMDIQMPVLNGYDATRQIRSLGTDLSRIPIIAMTANAYDEDRKLALEAGMNAHVTKPIDIGQLTEALKKFCR